MGYPHKPHSKETVLLSKHFGEVDARTYKGWVKRGGYEVLRQALTMEPAKVTDVVKESGLRGRGGGRVPPRPQGAVLAQGEKKAPHPGGDPPEAGAGNLHPKSTRLEPQAPLKPLSP